MTDQPTTFWGALSATLITLISSWTILRVLQSDLPPWTTKLLEKFGPVALVLVVLLAVAWYYLPRDFFRHFTSSRETQAAANALIATSLQSMAGQGGLLNKLEDHIDTVINTLGVLRIQMSDIRADITKIEMTMEARNLRFYHVEEVMAQILASVQSSIVPMTMANERALRRHWQERAKEAEK